VKGFKQPEKGQECVAACGMCGRLRYLPQRRRLAVPKCKGCGLENALVLLHNQEVILAAYLIGGYAAIGSDMIKETWLKVELVAREAAQDGLQALEQSLDTIDDI
jgi:hypothetical protein